MNIFCAAEHVRISESAHDINSLAEYAVTKL